MINKLLEETLNVNEIDVKKTLATAAATGLIGGAAMMPGLTYKGEKPTVPKEPRAVQMKPKEAGLFINMDAIAQIESSNDPQAVNPRTGARGLCQIMKPTWEESVDLMGENWSWADAFDPQKNRAVANFYMNTRIPQMLKFYKISDSIETRLAAYNWGIGNLKRVYEENPDGWLENLPSETKQYIERYSTVGEARGYWRDWTGLQCQNPDCRWRSYRKTVKATQPEVLRTMKCPKCGADLKLEESIREGREEKLEDEYQDLELEILQNPHGGYDVYMFGKIEWRNVPSFEVLKELLKKRLEESSIDYPRQDLDLDVWDKKDDTYTIKPVVRAKILDTLAKYPEGDLVDMAAVDATIHIVGSIGTNQYLDDSDIDVHIVVSKDVDFYGDEEFQKKVSTWFNEHRDEIDGYVREHPIEIYLQYDPNQDLMSDGCYDLMADKWLKGPLFVPTSFDPYIDFSHIADDIRTAVQDADKLFGELKRDVIDYDVIKAALEQLPPEDKKRLLQKLQGKLKEIEQDIVALYGKRKEWVDMRHFASKPETPEQAMKDVELAKKWRDTNAVFKFVNRYKYLRTISDLEKLLADYKITPDEIEVVKGIVGNV